MTVAAHIDIKHFDAKDEDFVQYNSRSAAASFEDVYSEFSGMLLLQQNR